MCMENTTILTHQILYLCVILVSKAAQHFCVPHRSCAAHDTRVLWKQMLLLLAKTHAHVILLFDQIMYGPEYELHSHSQFQCNRSQNTSYWKSQVQNHTAFPQSQSASQLSPIYHEICAFFQNKLQRETHTDLFLIVWVLCWGFVSTAIPTARHFSSLASKSSLAQWLRVYLLKMCISHHIHINFFLVLVYDLFVLIWESAGILKLQMPALLHGIV